MSDFESESNPYQSPQVADKAKTARTKVNFFRGFLMAAAWGAIGAAISPGGMLALAVVQFWTTNSRLDFSNDLHRLVITIPGAIVLSIVFSSAALASYTPAKGIGFVRCLIVLGLATFVSAFSAPWLLPFLGYPPPVGYRRHISLSEWIAVLAITSSAPLFVAALLLLRGLLHSRSVGMKVE